MTYKVITSQHEAERLAEQIFTCDDKPIIYIDYNDLRTLKKMSTLKYALSIKVYYSERFVDEVMKTIREQPIPITELRTYVLHVRVNHTEPSLTYENIGNLMHHVRNLKDTDSSDEYLQGLHTLTNHLSIPVGEWHINMIFGVDKTEEDHPEDEKQARL